MTPRNLRLALFVLCSGLASAVAAEAFVLAPMRTELPGSTTANKQIQVAIHMAPDIDSMVAQILARPLFSPSRMPPPTISEEEVVVEKKEPPQLQARLAGVTLGPEAREALFQRPGQKPTPVKVGGTIDGWKVSAIQFDRVVLSSEFGDQVVKLTYAPASAGDDEEEDIPSQRRARPAVVQANAAKAPSAAAQPGAKPNSAPARGPRSGRR